MSSIEIAATSVTPPGEVYVRATTAAVGGEVMLLTTADFNNRWITIQAEIDDVFVKFATTQAGAVPSALAVSVLTGTTPAPAVQGCLHIPAGTSKEFYLYNFIKSSTQGIWMGHISLAATGGTIRFYGSSGSRAL